MTCMPALIRGFPTRGTFLPSPGDIRPRVEPLFRAGTYVCGLEAGMPPSASLCPARTYNRDGWVPGVPRWTKPGPCFLLCFKSRQAVAVDTAERD